VEEIPCEAVQDGKRWLLGDGRESADDAGEIVLVFRSKVLDRGDAGGPDSEEGDEGHGTVVER
jgi:hypothetical protein